MSLKRSVPCRFCGELKVAGGALVSHERACGNPDSNSRRRSRYRELFFAINGIGPYACYFSCGTLVTFDEVVIHHIDGDHTNNDPTNLTAAHGACHTSHHFKELWAERRDELVANPLRGHRVPHSEDTKRRLKEMKQGTRPTDEAIQKAADHNRGRTREESTRRKLSDYAKNRTPEHQEKLNASARGRVISEETRHRMSESAKARTDRKKRSLGGDAI